MRRSALQVQLSLHQCTELRSAGLAPSRGVGACSRWGPANRRASPSPRPRRATSQSGVGQAVSGDDYRAAEPDTLRKFAVELISVWNTDRAEDIYRIVSAHMGVPLVEVGAGRGAGCSKGRAARGARSRKQRRGVGRFADGDKHGFLGSEGPALLALTP